jgi:hypothetical protein
MVFPLSGLGGVDVPEPDLSRFLAAQDGVYPQVLSELPACRKASPWLWFIFPQIAGLGQSDMARRYAIRDLAESSAYLNHPVLGPRLRAVTSLMLACDATSATQVLGSPDVESGSVGWRPPRHRFRRRPCLDSFQLGTVRDGGERGWLKDKGVAGPDRSAQGNLGMRPSCCDGPWIDSEPGSAFGEEVLAGGPGPQGGGLTRRGDHGVVEAELSLEHL